MEWFSSWIDCRVCPGCGRPRPQADQAEGRNSTRHRGSEVEPGSWMDRFTCAHGTDSTLLLWGRLHNIPTTPEQARRLAEARSRAAGHTLGSWRRASVLCSFYDTPGPEEHATCTTCGASAVAKADHRPAGSAVDLSCIYTQLMRRLARPTR